MKQFELTANRKGAKMSICVYDNPRTMRREAWQDGVMLSYITAKLLLSKGFKGGKMFDFRLNVGEWELGKFHHGDESAMQSTKE